MEITTFIYETNVIVPFFKFYDLAHIEDMIDIKKGCSKDDTIQE